MTFLAAVDLLVAQEPLPAGVQAQTSAAGAGEQEGEESGGTQSRDPDRKEDLDAFDARSRPSLKVQVREHAAPMGRDAPVREEACPTRRPL